MSFIYRLGLLRFLSCDAQLLLRRRGRLLGQSLSRGTAVRPTLRQERHRAVSAPCTLGRAWKKIHMGSFAARSRGCLWWSTHSSLPACLPSDRGFSCSISIKQVPPRDQGSRMGRLGATSPRPSPRSRTLGVLLKPELEPQGWSKRCWVGALPRPAKPCKELSAAEVREVRRPLIRLTRRRSKSHISMTKTIERCWTAMTRAELALAWPLG